MFLLPIIVVTAMYALYQYRNRRVFGAVSFLISVYVVMGLSGIALYVFFGYRASSPVQLEPMVFLSVCLVIAFSGVFAYSDKPHRVLVIENVRLLRGLETFQIVTSIAALIFFLPFAISGLSGDVSANRLNIDEIQEKLGSFGLINSFFSLVGNLFVLSILLAFVNLATIERGGSARRANILLILSSVNIVYVFAYVGRDGLVYWMLSFVFLYLLIRDFMPAAGRRKVRRIARVIALPAVIGFSVITASRFADQDSSVLSSLFVYAGSQVFNFNDQYLVNAPPTKGMVYFNRIVKLGDFVTGRTREPLVREDWWENYTAYDVQPWTFATFIGSWAQDLSRWGALLLTIAIAVCTRASLRKQAKTGVFEFSNMLYFILFSQIVLFGVFYYRQFATFYFQIAIVLIAISFRLLRGEDQKLVLEKTSPKSLFRR
jgi:oligosaccharide repeat unit polymerase